LYTKSSQFGQHLGNRPRVDPKLTRRFPAAQTLNLNRKTNLSIGAPRSSCPGPCRCPTKAICRRIFTPALPDCPVAA